MDAQPRRRVLAAVAAACATMLVGPAAGNAAPPVAPPTPGPDGWVTLPGKGQALADTHRELVQGQREHGVCRYKVELRLPPNAHAVAANEVARNDTACQETIEVGTPLDITPPPHGSAQDVHSQSDRAQARPSPGTHGPPSGNRRFGYGYPTESAGYMDTWWTDPIGIVVNEVSNNVDWWWDGTCVTGPAWVGYYYSWFWPTTWALNWSYWYYGVDCDAAWSGSYVEFINYAFCAPFTPWNPTTYTDYLPNEVDGWWDGYLTGRIYSYSSGSLCSYLLRGNYQLVRTYY
jgi:hypothetical protein